jgi:hypothetical protein
MKINFGNASIIDKKVNLFARAVREIFNFFFGIPTFGPPCIFEKTELNLSESIFVKSV